MSQPRAVAEAFIQLWNEGDPERRREVLEAAWHREAVYADPLAHAAGREAIAEMIGAVRAQFAGCSFRLAAADGHGPFVRLAWELGPAGAEAAIAGTDVLRLENGRVREVIAFLDRVPEGAA